MTRLNRWLIGLLLLQCALLLGFRLLGGGHAPVKTRKLFEGLDVAAVTRVHLGGQDKKAADLEKKGSGWVLQSGGGFPVQEDKVKGFLAKLPNLSAREPVTTQATHQRALEVATDTFQREVRIEQAGKKPLTFYLGTSAGLKDVHFRFAEENEIYLVKDLSPWDAGTAASDWISTDYLKLERDRITSLSITNPEGSVQLTKGADGKWSVAGLAEGAKLKDGEVDSLLSSVSSVTMQEPVGTRVETSQGLEKPAATVTVVTTTGDKPKEPAKPEAAQAAEASAAGTKTHRLLIGAKDGETYFAKADASPFVVRLSTWTAETFLKKKTSDFEQKEDKSAPASPPSPEGMMPGMEPPSQP